MNSTFSRDRSFTTICNKINYGLGKPLKRKRFSFQQYYSVCVCVCVWVWYIRDMRDCQCVSKIWQAANVRIFNQVYNYNELLSLLLSLFTEMMCLSSLNRRWFDFVTANVTVIFFIALYSTSILCVLSILGSYTNTRVSIYIKYNIHRHTHTNIRNTYTMCIINGG